MHWPAWVIPVLGGLGVTAAAVLLVKAIAAGINRRIAGPHPESPALPDAVTRRFQSFHIGGMSLLWGFHVSVDDRALHLRATAFARVLGLRGASVPWESVEFRKKSRSGRWVSVRVNGIGIEGPGWCLGLAAPGRVPCPPDKPPTRGRRFRPACGGRWRRRS